MHEKYRRECSLFDGDVDAVGLFELQHEEVAGGQVIVDFLAIH